MIRSRLILCGLGLLTGLVAPVAAQDMSVLLSKQATEVLPKEAQDLYNDGIRKADIVWYAGAVDDFAQAAAIAPEHIDLQFLTAKWSRYQAEISYGDESRRFYEIAEAALRRLLANPQLGPEERSRATREAERIRESKNQLRKRDEDRMSSGFDLVLLVRDERVAVSDLGRGTESPYPGMPVGRGPDLAKIQQEKDEKGPTQVYPWEEDEPLAKSLQAMAQNVAQGGTVINDATGFGGFVDDGGPAAPQDPFAAGGQPAYSPYGAPPPAQPAYNPYGGAPPAEAPASAPPAAASDDPFAG